MEEQNPHIPAGLIRNLRLPRDLGDAVALALAATPAARWIRAAQELSERYRGPRAGEEQPLATGSLQALGYAALLLPATYAQLRGALAATAARLPGWSPTTLLDLGSGPGTALWAAVAQWPSLQTLLAWEREPAFIALGRELARGSNAAPLQNTRWERVDLLQLDTTDRSQYDLVILGHVLNELGPDQQRLLVARAWQLTSGVLLIVEPGTPATFAVVRAARDQLLAAQAHTIAPCAHDMPCPLLNDWCHFPQRLVRPEFQRRARGALSQWEDSKFSYAAMARFAPTQPIWGRVIAEVVSNKAYAEATISTVASVEHYRVLKRHKDAFKQLRDLAWGQALWEPPEAIG